MSLGHVENSATGSIAKLVPWLAILAFALLPVGRLSEIPLVILALIGLSVLARKGKVVIQSQQVIYFSLFYLCFWIPALCSLPDSYNFKRTLSLVFEYIRFFLSGIAVLHYCVTYKTIRMIGSYSSCALVIWILYGMLHLFFAPEILKIPFLPQWLIEVFSKRFATNMVLAASASFLFTVLTVNKTRIVFWISANLACLVVLMLGGSRGALIMYGCITIGFIVFLCRGDIKKIAAGVIVFLTCLGAVGIVLNYNSDKFSARFNQTLEIFKGDYKSVDTALSLRLPIWEAAVSMIRDNLINGVGARSFRYAYPEYAAKDDIFLESDPRSPQRIIGAAHSHQMELEVLCETGLVGGVFFLISMGLLLRYWYTRTDYEKFSVLPYALSSLAIFFPLNTHPALYSSVWSQTIYWFVTLFFAAGAVSDPGKSSKGT